MNFRLTGTLFRANCILPSASVRMLTFISSVLIYEHLNYTTLGSVSGSVRIKKILVGNSPNLYFIHFARLAGVYLSRVWYLALTIRAGGLENLVLTTEVKILPYRPTKLC